MTPKSNGGCCGKNAQSYKDHAYLVHNTVGLHNSIDHKSHEDKEDGNPDHMLRRIEGICNLRLKRALARSLQNSLWGRCCRRTICLERGQ